MHETSGATPIYHPNEYSIGPSAQWPSDFNAQIPMVPSTSDQPIAIHPWTPNMIENVGGKGVEVSSELELKPCKQIQLPLAVPLAPYTVPIRYLRFTKTRAQ